MRRVGFVALGILVLLLVGCVAAFLLVGQLDLGSFAAGRASAALNRTVTIAGLHVTPGRWLTIDLDRVRVDNLPGGSQPAMAELGHLTAEVEAISLLHGPANVRRLTIDKLQVLLERTKDGESNWRFGRGKPHPADPTGRSSFPTLLDARLRESEITFRLSSGKALRTRLDDAAILTRSVDEPVRLTAAGAYNATPVRLEGDLASFEALRNLAVPYKVALRMASDGTRLDFEGTMTDPLNVDGAQGTLALAAPTLGPLLAIAGTRSDQAASLRLAGKLDRRGDEWRMTEVSGALNDGAITAATLRLAEGARSQPDDVGIDIAFDRLDLDALLGARKTAGRSDADMPLAISRTPGAVVEAKLSARQLVYAGFGASDVRLEGALKPGVAEVKVLAFNYLGALAKASGRIEPAQEGGRVTADVSVSGADAAQFGRALTFGNLPLAGRLDAGMVASGEAATLNAAVRGARVSAVVSMTGGSIARNVIELASTDVRRLFRKPSGMTPVSCLLGVLDMRAGIGVARPLRIRAAEGTIAGSAQFDLYRHWFDLTIGSQPATTGLLALDIPMRAHGAFGSPTVEPARWSAEGRALLANAVDVTPLPEVLRELAHRNPCVSPR